MLRVRSPQDFGAGVMFMLIGLAGLYFGRDLAFGTSRSMGPGYFPIILSALIVLIGAIVALKALAADGPAIGALKVRPLVFVIASILIFALLIGRAGLVVSSALLALAATYARGNAKLLEALLLAAGLAIFAIVVFVLALGQPMPIWWS